MHPSYANPELAIYTVYYVLVKLIAHSNNTMEVYMYFPQ